MMSYTIENGELKAIINTKGAELSSLKDEDGKEYIWHGDPEHWGRHSPVLFPIVGKLKDNTFIVDGVSYQMSQHGFARDMDFELIKQEKGSLLFELQSNSETLKLYPFEFVLRIGYTLKGKSLEVSYQVSNPSDKELFFSIGAHPAFNCPIEKGTQRDDYFLKFDKKISADICLIEGGLQNGKKVELLDNQGSLWIKDDLFKRDALVFKQFPSSKVSLADENLNPYVTVDFKGFPYLGIWSPSEEAPFVCIEPWFGIADHQKTTQILQDKEGIMSLEPDEKFKASYWITIN
ncbi:aldose 1-epimerase family protein [Limibacter armeniacum]|uniref:aldose 1-epimerase family protein n=1 Tax=Limibacter armeniacum TaxID=466084 RepID=UPI002FE5E2F9